MIIITALAFAVMVLAATLFTPAAGASASGPYDIAPIPPAALQPAAPADISNYFEDATVIAEEVNLRLRPTTDSPSVSVLHQGNRIGVFCEEQPGWYRVIFGNYRGYVASEYIFLPSVDTMIGHVMVDGLHLRPNPTTECEIICDVPVGSAVTIHDIRGDWYYVDTDIMSEEDQAIDPSQDGEDNRAAAQYETRSGYVHKDYIKLSTAKTTSPLLKPEMSGVAIADMQRELKSRGFFGGSVTGYYGDVTLAAVQMFQKEAGISQDGIVGEETLNLLYGDNDIKTNAAKIAGIEGAVQMSSWNEIDKKFEEGDTALVTDVKTGLQFEVYRFGGWWHADCEPVTAKDTAIMKQCYSGSWSWDRRAIWVTVGGVTYAASQNGMPHLSSPVSGNDFNGHFCIHFNDSMVHQTGRECSRHQACVDYAYRKAQ